MKNSSASAMVFSVMMLTVIVNTVESADILAIFPTPSYSHQVALQAVSKALSNRGHNVTVISPDPLKVRRKNYTDIDLSFSYKYFTPQKNTLEGAMVNQRRVSSFEFMRNIGSVMNAYTEDQLSSEAMFRFISYIEQEKPQYDLVLYEGLLHTAYLGLVAKLGFPPLVVIQTLNPTCFFSMHSDTLLCNPSYVPEIISGYTQNMNLWQRVINALIQIYSSYYLSPSVRKHQDYLMEKYLGVSHPTGKTMEENKTLLMLSTSWLVSYPRPVFPNTIMLGPLHIGDPKPLPQELETWFQGADKGVIYFSLGSNTRSATLQTDRIKAFISAFAQLPEYRILWKWEEDEIPELPKNVMSRKWLPQQSILAHAKVKLFISQCGLQSTQEAIHFGVPVIGIPFLGDQVSNIRKLESLGVGKHLELEEITGDIMRITVRSILNDESFHSKMKTYSKLSHTQMVSPVDSAVWWVEYVIKAKGDVSHLKLNLEEIPWHQYYLVDITLLLVGGTIFLVCILYGLGGLFIGFYFSHKFKKKKTN